MPHQTGQIVYRIKNLTYNNCRVPLRLIMLLILSEMTTEFKETSQIYEKCYRHGNKILLESTKYSTK